MLASHLGSEVRKAVAPASPEQFLIQCSLSCHFSFGQMSCLSRRVLDWHGSSPSKLMPTQKWSRFQMSASPVSFFGTLAQAHMTAWHLCPFLFFSDPLSTNGPLSDNQSWAPCVSTRRPYTSQVRSLPEYRRLFQEWLNMFGGRGPMFPS